MSTVLPLKIKENRLFNNISLETITDCIIPNGRIKKIQQNENLFMPLDRVNTIYILLAGKIKSVYYMENGDQDIKNMLLPGNLVGIDLICTRTQLSHYQATAVVGSELFAFTSDIILKPGVLPENERQTCLNNLLLILSNINIQNQYHLAILTHKGLRDRIMIYLSMQANRTQSEVFTIPFDREEMASYLCVNRSALSHELSLLKREGIIDFCKNEFSLLKHNSFPFDSENY